MDRKLHPLFAVALLVPGCSAPTWIEDQFGGANDNGEFEEQQSNAISTVAASSGQPQEATVLSYYPPGKILPNDVGGITTRRVDFADWTFPMPVGVESRLHAYMGTQLSRYHGEDWNDDPVLYSYPHRDNQCEPRQKAYANELCPMGQGHQGVDIRPNDNTRSKWDVVAVDGGVVTLVTDYTTVSIRSGITTVQYLHMDRDSISEYGISPGVVVEKGQRIGRVSCIMAGRCNTSLHLHLHAYSGTLGSGQMYHVYPSLVAAYRRAWELDGGIADRQLVVDNRFEVAAP